MTRLIHLHVENKQDHLCYNELRSLDCLWLVYLQKVFGDELAHEYERSEQIEVMPILEYKTCFTEIRDLILTLSQKRCVSSGSLENQENI